MVFSRESSVEEQLESTLQTVAAQAALMRKTLGSPQGKLLVAVKQVTTMLGELMTSKLPPRLYYELYNSCFDTLSQLQEYLLEDHKNHHLADVYEIVEYISNVLPRLYLMITVGTAFLASGDAPKTEVLKDMLEMTRGIQNPLRGLFLRYYLGQRTGEFLIGNKVDTQFSVQFTLTNFIEMNKLWVRYQHQGHSRDYEQRLKERVQLQTIVGSSILRLSQLDAVDIHMFANQILPAILDQTVQCRDQLAQEYLLDVIVQVFPAEFHLETLELFLDCIEFLNPETSCSIIMLASIHRIIGYARSKKLDLESLKLVRDAEKLKLDQTPPEPQVTEPKLSEIHETANESDETQNGESRQDQHSQEAEDPESKDSEAEGDEQTEPASVSSDNVKEEHETHSDEQPSQQSSEAGDDAEGSPVPSHQSADGSSEVKADTEKNAQPEEPSSGPENENQDSSEVPPQKSNDSESKPSEVDEFQAFAAFFSEAVSLYWNKMRSLKLDIRQRAQLVHALIELLEVTENLIPLSDLFGFVVTKNMEQSEEVSQLILSLFDSNQDFQDIMGLLREFPQLLSSQSKTTRHTVAEKVINQVLVSSKSVNDASQTQQVLELFATLLRSGGFDTSKVSHFVRIIRADSVTSTLELLQLAHKTMREGGQPVVQKTSGVIVHAALLLIRQGDPEAADVAKVLKFVNRACHDLATVGNSPFAAYRLYLSAGQAADYCGAEEAAYELFVQAFTIYEELILDSRQQILALAIAIQILQHMSVFTSGNFEPLAQRCTQYGQRLLKKPDQCRTLLLASHLYWDNDYSDARRVEDTLNRALRSADSVMDILISIELFLDVLDANLYFLANDTSTVTVSSVNSLLKLIKDNIENAKNDGYGDVATQTTASTPSANLTTPLPELEARLDRTRKFVIGQIHSFPRFEGVKI